ncbi:MAG: sigma-70 family RNA polymerase sigma factor [Bacillota bacterium]
MVDQSLTWKSVQDLGRVHNPATESRYHREASPSRRTANLPREVAEDLYLRFYDSIFHQVFLVTGDRDCAVEATQEAFLRAFEQFNTLREPEKFPAWVGSIAINSATDTLRRRRREIPSDAEMLDAAGQQQAADDPEGRICHLEQIQSLTEAIQRLPLDSRAVIVMYYLQEQGVAGIARSLGIPEGTVKSRLYHARSLLRRFVERDPERDAISN